MSKGELISGFAEESGWICAFKDISPNHFGFVPKDYLKFAHRTNSQSVTPRSEMGKSRDMRAGDISPNTAFQMGNQVKNFLDDIYADATEGADF